MVCCVIVMVCSFHSLLWFVASIVALVFLFPLLSWFVTFIVSLVCCFHCCHSFSLSLMPWFVASIVVIICHFECFLIACHFHCCHSMSLSLSGFVTFIVCHSFYLSCNKLLLPNHHCLRGRWNCYVLDHGEPELLAAYVCHHNEAIKRSEKNKYLSQYEYNNS